MKERHGQCLFAFYEYVHNDEIKRQHIPHKTGPNVQMVIRVTASNNHNAKQAYQCA